MSLPSNAEFHQESAFEEKDLKKLVRKHGSAFMSDVLKESLKELQDRLAGLAEHEFYLTEAPKLIPQIVKLKNELDALMAPINEQKRENRSKAKIVNQQIKFKKEQAGIEV